MTQLQCPLCNNSQTWVIDTRQTKTGTRRRYGCPKCKERFTTFETIVRDRLIQEIEGKVAQIASLKTQAEKLEEEIETLRLRQQAEKERQPKREKPSPRPMSLSEREMLAARREVLRGIVKQAKERFERERVNGAN